MIDFDRISVSSAALSQFQTIYHSKELHVVVTSFQSDKDYKKLIILRTRTWRKHFEKFRLHPELSSHNPTLIEYCTMWLQALLLILKNPPPELSQTLETLVEIAILTRNYRAQLTALKMQTTLPQ